MRINWKNIYGLLGVIFSIYLFCKVKPIAAAWFDSMADNREFFDKHPALPFLAIAVICVMVVAVAKILSNR